MINKLKEWWNTYKLVTTPNFILTYYRNTMDNQQEQIRALAQLQVNLTRQIECRDRLLDIAEKQEQFQNRIICDMGELLPSGVAVRIMARHGREFQEAVREEGLENDKN